MVNVGDPREEYRELNANMRYYANLRFAQLTIFVALTGSLIAALFTKDISVSPLAQFLLKVAGGYIAAMFWIMEERAADYWHHYRKRAVELEDLLGYRQHKDRPRKTYLVALFEDQLGYWQHKDRPTWTFLTATNAARAIYVGSIVWWLIALLEQIP